MITEKYSISFENFYPSKFLGSPDKLVFFDIETTGFSNTYSQVYLIGCVYFFHKQWQIIQWFADNMKEEKEILIAFFDFIKNFKILVHFNGESFDIPFLLKRCQAYELNFDVSVFTSIDIFKQIRPYRKILGLDNLKQKSIEQFLGIFRQDLYSGAQLIDVYKDYMINRNSTLYEILLLHNREDLEGMLLILPVLSYVDFFEQDFVLKGQQILELSDISKEKSFCLCLSLESLVSVPVEICWETPHAKCLAKGKYLELTIELFNGTLKHFYPDYKNYYYLIYEDRAVHKSVGEFVEKEARKKATAQTCYAKKTSIFVPQPEKLWSPTFQKDYRTKQLYAEYQPDLLESPKALIIFIRYLLES